MFQAAAGMAVAKRNNTPLLLDISSLRKYHKHNGYQFPEIFETPFALASKWELLYMLTFEYRKVLYGPITGPVKLKLKNKKLVHYQLQHDFSNDFYGLNDPCYLSGYWQSEKFFEGAEVEIRRLFNFREPIDSANLEMARKISTCNAVSLHVRRGDYVSEPNTNAFHGVCSWDYYEAAMDYMLTKIPNARFFAFSDDPQWVRDKVQGQYPLMIVDINHGPKSYLDMYLMTRCEHHIIANSSFSWWGAYLGRNNQKIVIAPSPWFSGEPNAMKDIYCSGWKVL